MDLLLEDRAVLALSGPDAMNFLQGLVTNDMRQVRPGALRYAALLTPQGKILFDFLICHKDGTILLDCPKAQREPLARRLGHYRLRANVDITARDDLAVAWRKEKVTPPYLGDPRHPHLGGRAILALALSPHLPGAETFRELRLACGVPEGQDFGQDQMFALDADLDELGGIAFEKGCYVGQELTARMKHRGTARKRLLAIAARQGRSLPAPPVAVLADGRDLGVLHSAHADRGFALIRLDRLAEAEGHVLRVGAVEIDVLKPEWLFS